MFINLTKTNGTVTFVNVQSIAYFIEVENGTRIVFTGGEGKNYVEVSEDYIEVSRLIDEKERL